MAYSPWGCKELYIAECTHTHTQGLWLPPRVGSRGAFEHWKSLIVST